MKFSKVTSVDETHGRNVKGYLDDISFAKGNKFGPCGNRLTKRVVICILLYLLIRPLMLFHFPDQRVLFFKMAPAGHVFPTRCKWTKLEEPADELPGSFANNRLYFTGVRFTPSHDSTTTLHVDVFGFPGDLLTRQAERQGWNRCNGMYSGLDELLLKTEEIQENLTLYCQLDCSMEVIPMLMVPITTIQLFQQGTTIVWRGNITHILDKNELVKAARQLNSVPTWRVHFLAQFLREPITKVATVDIPLDTGVVGQGGPQVRSSLIKSYFLQPPVSVGLCVPTHGTAHRYLVEFVQHHLNVGFGSIVVGLQAHPDDLVVAHASRLLRKYIDAGVVALAYYSVRDEWGCNTDVNKLQFFQTCLFYHKGIAKYSATWDLDEYWTPPKKLHMDGLHNHPYHQVWKGDFEPKHKAINKSNIIYKSKWSMFPSFVRTDRLWQLSNYSKSVSVADTLKAIDQFYLNSLHCPNMWCFHLFSNRYVHLKHPTEKRTNFVGQDFYLIEPDVNSWMVEKHVANTKYAHLASFHSSGSCLFQSINASLPVASQMKLYHLVADRDECIPTRFKGEVYGFMNHFSSLFQNRDGPLNASWSVSSYVESFASTVELQMRRNDAFHQL